MIRLQRFLDCGVLLAALALPVVAQTIQPPDSIRNAATAFVSGRMQSPGSDARVHVQAGTLDPRLRLSSCTLPLEAFTSGELRAAPRVTVGVRCLQPAWTVYVPVSVETELDVLVLQRALPRNSAILPADTRNERRRVPGVAASYITNVTQLTNRHLRATAVQGTALTVEMLSADVLVRRGQRITLIATAGGLEVRAQGEALSDATPDGRVRVLNLNSRRVVEGRVESPDSVRVSL